MTIRRGEVVAVLSARVSEFAHKSINASEDTKVFMEPDIERANQLKKWYNAFPDNDKMDLHALSTGLSVDKCMGEEEESS